MSTRSRIGMEYTDMNGNRKVKSIYCHFDGYPHGVGQTLMEHYDREKTEQLIELGDISYLEKEVSRLTPNDGTRPHSFDHPIPGVTVAYHRDRGEEYTPADVAMGVAHFFQSDFEQYGYVLTEEGEWLVSGGGEPVPLAYVLSGIENI